VIAFGVMRELAASGDELRVLAAAGKKPVLRDDDPRGAAADAVLKDALAAHPKHAGLWCAQAEWNRARDRAMHALASYRRAQQADPGCIAAWLGAARLLREREQWADAEDYARKGLLQRRDPALRQEFALALVGQGKLSDAELQLEACMKERPDDKDTARVLANVLVGRAYAGLSDSTDRADVVRLIERALAYNPDDPKAHFVIGRIAKEEKRYELAVRELAIAYKRMPDFAEAREAYTSALGALGWDRLLRRDEDGAVDAWLQCVATAPPDFELAPIREQLELAWKRSETAGVRKLQAGDKPGAVAAFRRCLQIRPEQHWAGWLLAQTLQDDPAADLAELEQLCRRAVAWQEKHGIDKSKQVLLLATTLVRAGKLDDAKTVAAEYLRAPDPDAKEQVLTALKRVAEG
jgi:tetratricopeptide (TPR) repeat protein